MEYSILYLYLFSYVIIRYLILSDFELSATVFPSVSFICQYAYVLLIYPTYRVCFPCFMWKCSGNENLSIPRKSSNYLDARCIHVTGYQYLESKLIAPLPKVKLKCPLAIISRKRILRNRKLLKWERKKIKIEIEIRNHVQKMHSLKDLM